MHVTICFTPNPPIDADVKNLLTKYQYAGNGKIDIEHIDPERNLSRAKELFDKYKVVTDESLLVLDYEGRNKRLRHPRWPILTRAEWPSAKARVWRRSKASKPSQAR